MLHRGAGLPRTASVSKHVPDSVQKSRCDDSRKCDEDGDHQVTHHIAGQMSEGPQKHDISESPHTAHCGVSRPQITQSQTEHLAALSGCRPIEFRGEPDSTGIPWALHRPSVDFCVILQPPIASECICRGTIDPHLRPNGPCPSNESDPTWPCLRAELFLAGCPRNQTAN